MKKIELSESCFGPDVEIDGESLFIHEYDNRKPELIENLQIELIEKLKSSRHELGMNHWYQIAEIVTSVSSDFEFDVDESNEGDSCGQCGNYNWNYIYKLKEHDKES